MKLSFRAQSHLTSGGSGRELQAPRGTRLRTALSHAQLLPLAAAKALGAGKGTGHPLPGEPGRRKPGASQSPVFCSAAG